MSKDCMIYTFVSLHLIMCVDRLPTTLDLKFFTMHFSVILDQASKT